MQNRAMCHPNKIQVELLGSHVFVHSSQFNQCEIKWQFTKSKLTFGGYYTEVDHILYPVGVGKSGK